MSSVPSFASNPWYSHENNAGWTSGSSPAPFVRSTGLRAQIVPVNRRIAPSTLSRNSSRRRRRVEAAAPRIDSSNLSRPCRASGGDWAAAGRAGTSASTSRAAGTILISASVGFASNGGTLDRQGTRSVNGVGTFGFKKTVSLYLPLSSSARDENRGASVLRSRTDDHRGSGIRSRAGIGSGSASIRTCPVSGENRVIMAP